MSKLEKLLDELEKEQKFHLDCAKERFSHDPESMEVDAPLRLAERQESIRTGYILGWNECLQSQSERLKSGDV